MFESTTHSYATSTKESIGGVPFIFQHTEGNNQLSVYLDKTPVLYVPELSHPRYPDHEAIDTLIIPQKYPRHDVEIGSISHTADQSIAYLKGVKGENKNGILRVVAAGGIVYADFSRVDPLDMNFELPDLVTAYLGSDSSHSQSTIRAEFTGRYPEPQRHRAPYDNVRLLRRGEIVKALLQLPQYTYIGEGIGDMTKSPVFVPMQLPATA